MEFVTEVKLYKKWIFFLTFIIGASCIVFLKFLSINQLWVTFIPVGLMFGYFFFLPKNSDNLENTNQYGDSLYYLGFLFTLVSLACSLVRFNMINEGVDVIISNLGIALATTICGMVLRIVYLQLLDVGFTDEDIRHEFNKTALQLKEELGNALLDINLIREQTKTVLGDLRKDFEETHKKRINSTTEVYKSHEYAVASFSKYYKKELTTLIDDVKYFCDVSIQESKENHQKNDEMYNDSLKKSIDNYDNAINQLVKNAKLFEDNQKKHLSTFDQTLDTTISSLKNFTLKIKEIESAPEEMVKKMNENLMDFDRTIHEVNEKMTGNIENHKIIGANFKSISKDTKILISDYKDFNITIKEINSNIEKIDANIINEAIKEYQTTISQFTVASSKFIDSFNSSAEKIIEFNDNLDNIKITPNELINSITDSFSTIETVVSKVSKISDENLELQKATNFQFKGMVDNYQDLQTQYENFRKIMENNLDNMDSFNQKIGKLNLNLNSDGIASNFKEYERSMELMKEKSKTYFKFFESVKGNVETFNKSIEDDMLKSKDHVSQVYNSLLNMTDLIASNVKSAS